MTEPKPEHVDVLRELRSCGRLRRRAEERLDVARQEMYTTIGRAIYEGVPYAAIAEATGLTKGMIAHLHKASNEEHEEAR